MSAADAFLAAARRGDAEAIAGFLRASPDLLRSADAYAKTALHLAAEADHLEAARVLLDAGADIEAETSWGATAFEWAASMGSNAVAELLLERGAKGYTLITAAAMGNLDAVERFLAAGGDLSAHRRRGAPPTPDDHWPPDSAHIRGDVLSDALFAAGRNGRTEVAAFLLDRGADVNAKGVFGGTALHWAAINGHAATVELLVSRGADTELRDARFDASPQGWAEEGGHDAIAGFLTKSLSAARKLSQWPPG